MAKNVVGVCEENAHYLAVDGVPVFLVGATHLHGWTPISRPEHDYLRDLDRLQETVSEVGSDHVRGLARIVPYFPQPEGMQPWERQTDGLYRLDMFDAAWDARLEDFLEAALSRGIVVSVEVWDDWSVTRGAGGATDPGPEAGWNAHPFNPQNNANYDEDVLPAATRLIEAPFYRTIPEKDGNEQVLELQNLYVEHLCGITGNFPNVLHSVSNESRASLEWSRYWVGRLHELLGEGHLVGDMPSTNRRDGRGECDPELNPRSLIAEDVYDFIDVSQAVSRHEFGETREEEALCAGNRLEGYRGEMDEYGNQKPLVVSKDYTNYPPEGVRVLWAKFVGGAAAARYHRPMPSDEVEELAEFQFEQVRRLGSFAASTEFWQMRPNHDLALELARDTAALVLENPGKEYVIEIIGGKKAEFTMMFEPGEYELSWYDPRRDKWVAEDVGVVSDGTGETIQTPSHGGDLIGHAVAV